MFEPGGKVNKRTSNIASVERTAVSSQYDRLMRRGKKGLLIPRYQRMNRYKAACSIVNHSKLDPAMNFIVWIAPNYA